MSLSEKFKKLKKEEPGKLVESKKLVEPEKLAEPEKLVEPKEVIEKKKEILDKRTIEILSTKKPENQKDRKKVTDYYLKQKILKAFESFLKQFDENIEISEK